MLGHGGSNANPRPTEGDPYDRLLALVTEMGVLLPHGSERFQSIIRSCEIHFDKIHQKATKRKVTAVPLTNSRRSGKMTRMRTPIASPKEPKQPLNARQPRKRTTTLNPSSRSWTLLWRPPPISDEKLMMRKCSLIKTTSFSLSHVALKFCSTRARVCIPPIEPRPVNHSKQDCFH
jgi:hypothetical protein